MKIGISIDCSTCRRSKPPRGRSVADAMYGSVCNSECPGYWEDPKPGDLWPGETEEDFGFPVSSNATREPAPQ